MVFDERILAVNLAFSLVEKNSFTNIKTEYLVLTAMILTGRISFKLFNDKNNTLKGLVTVCLVCESLVDECPYNIVT